MKTSRGNLPKLTKTQTWWVPSPGQRYQIQFIDYPVDLMVEANIFEIDLFETPQQAIDELHERGKKVVCYLNAGAWEDFRPDAGDFPEIVIGHDYIGWPGEKWLDISHYQQFSHIIEARFDLAVQKGCDAVDPDNVQNYQQLTGFDISYEDQLIYNRWLSRLAHERDLGIGLKNNPEQVTDLLPYFDFSVVEDCAKYNECSSYLDFIEAGKVVFQIEYTDFFVSADQFCTDSTKNGFSVSLKNRQLDSWVQFCQ